MPSISGLAATAALVGDPARAGMLMALMDGRALTAGELARAAGITPQTASGHLAQLTEAQLLSVQAQGRHRYYRVASEAVARMLEGILAVADRGDVRPVVVGPRDRALRRLRTCFDHLAGEMAVAIAERMVARGQLELSPDGGALTPDGSAFLAGLGVDIGPARKGAVLCRPCLDWSERRLHLAGTVGTALCTACLSRGWVRRLEGTRALAVTPVGAAELREAFGPL